MSKVKTIEKQHAVYAVHYYKAGPNNASLNPLVGNNPPTVNYNADPITNSSPFKYKSSITGKHQMRIKKMVKTLRKQI